MSGVPNHRAPELSTGDIFFTFAPGGDPLRFGSYRPVVSTKEFKRPENAGGLE